LRKWLFSAWAYFNYWLKKEDRYSQQSPYIFDRYNALIHFLEENEEGDFQIEQFRKALLKDTATVEVLDLGAGSRKVPNPIREVADVARFSTSGIKFCQLYRFFCGLTPAHYVIELGTCVGISTRYLSKSTRGGLYSLEGAIELQKVAKREPVPKNATFVLGQIQETLPLLLDRIPRVDFALIDANHTYEGTISSFNLLMEKADTSTIIAIGDIHWTFEMEQAWQEIKSNPQVRLTMDFFESGVVFFDFPGKKTDLILDI
jgi:predicted O-methyltransferase YrrM